MRRLLAVLAVVASASVVQISLPAVTSATAVSSEMPAAIPAHPASSSDVPNVVVPGNDPDNPAVPSYAELEAEVAPGEQVSVNVAVQLDDGNVRIETREATGPRAAMAEISDAAAEPDVVAADVAKPVESFTSDPYRQKVLYWPYIFDGQYGLSMMCTDADALLLNPNCGPEHSYQYATGAGQVIAVLDDPVQTNHPDLAANTLGAISCLSDPCTPVTYNASTAGQHGTHVAGIAAAVTDNDIGVAGQAKAAKILPITVLPKGSGGDTGMVARGIAQATAANADVINMSLGSYGDDKAMQAAVNAALAKNIAVVAAAGNDGATAPVSYPAAYDNVIGVGAVTQDFSAWSGSSRGYWVDIVAPGADFILSTWPTGDTCQANINGLPTTILTGYCYQRGTSMATPFVAGAVAQIRELNGYLSPAEIQALLASTARDLGTAGRDDTYGHGLIDIVSALQSTPPAVGAPTNLSFEPGDASVAVSFDAPELTPGRTITGYQYSLDAGSWVNAKTEEPPIEITGLTNGTTYSLRLRAVTAAGFGAASEPLAVTASATPGPPSISEIVPGDGQVQVTFAAPASLGGSAISNYEYSIDGGETWVARAPVSATSPLTITGLINGTEYDVALRAVNAAGAGTPCAAVAATPGVPAAPLEVRAEPIDGAALLSFTAGSDNGGGAISNYEHSVSSDGQTWTAWQALDPADSLSPVLVPGLVNGTTYQVMLRAINAAGIGGPSQPVTVTPRTVPTAPRDVVATPGNRSISVTFTAPADNGGAAIEVYEFGLSADSGKTWTPWTTALLDSSGSAFTIADLTNGTAYQVRIRAVNPAGAGDDSEVTSATPRTVPDAPSITTLTSGDRQLSVEFVAPEFDGGAAIATYDYSIDGGSTWKARTPTSAASPLVISGLTNRTEYAIAIRAVNPTGPGASSQVLKATPTSPWPEYVAVSPARFADTRVGQDTVDGQGPKGALSAGGEQRVQIAGRDGLPATGIGAVAVNITATGSSAGTFLTAWPTGENRPTASNVNPAAGQTVPNMAIVKLGPDGSISLYNAKGNTHIIVDVLGWFPADADYNAVSPARFADTRVGQDTVDGQGPKGALSAGGEQRVQIAGRDGLPATGIGAVAVNITATGSSAGTFLTAWPTGENRPTASNVNPAAGQTVPNMAIVKLGPDGSISLYNAKGNTHIIIDVLGWFPADADYNAVSPARFADTRVGQDTVDGQGPKGALSAGGEQRVQIAGRDGLPATGIGAVAVNITATGSSAGTFLTAWPTGENRPTASNVNPAAGQTVPNMAIVKLGPDGSISLYNAKGNTHIIIDVLGWFPE